MTNHNAHAGGARMMGTVDKASPPAAIDASTATRAKRPFPAWAPMVLAFVCLALWWIMPIYPDEIAFRQQFGKFIADGGVLHGLYALCESNAKTVPLILRPAAYALAATMQVLSPLEMRVLSFAAVLGVVFTTLRLVAGERNPSAGFLTLAGFVGVAGSGLILVRYEFALEIHLLSCLVVVGLLRRPKASPVVDAFAAFGLLAGAALSVLSHLQGLLLLPLSALLMFRLGFRRFGTAGAGALTFGLLLLVPPALALQRATCAEHPEIEAFWREMVFNVATFPATDPLRWLLDKWSIYAETFRYAPKFAVRYLPGVETSSPFVDALNISISAVLAFVAIVAVLTPVVVGFIAFRRFRSPSHTRSICDREPLSMAIVSAFILLPIVFLFAYDGKQSFYRDFYINHFAAIGIALAVSVISTRFAAAVWIACASIATVAVASAAANAALLVPPLWQGYEGPSLSVFHDWAGTRRDVELLARKCGADLDRGESSSTI